MWTEEQFHFSLLLPLSAPPYSALPTKIPQPPAEHYQNDEENILPYYCFLSNKLKVGLYKNVRKQFYPLDLAFVCPSFNIYDSVKERQHILVIPHFLTSVQG